MQQSYRIEVFCAALINTQPMGFYAIAQVVRDAAEHGAEIRPVCINASNWDCTLKPTISGKFAVRLKLRLISALPEAAVQAMVAEWGKGRVKSIGDLWLRTRTAVSLDRCLAQADAFLPSIKVARREALWTIKSPRNDPLPLFALANAGHFHSVEQATEPMVALRATTEEQEVVKDYHHVDLTLRRHPVSFLRNTLQARSIVPCAYRTMPEKRNVIVAGLC